MKIKNWIIFIKERFDPLSHSLMLLVFVIVHILMALKLFGTPFSPFYSFILFFAVTLFYFKLRLYDEVKDYELDVVINPHRPLPRGLLKHKNMFQGMFLCIILELLFFSTQGQNATLSIAMAILYSLLMYKEFFIKDYIRPHLTTYAISHTVVTSLLTMAIFTFITQKSYSEILSDKNIFYFSLTNWMLFNIFEFGRKTYMPSEERPNIDTYSSLFGKIGAVLLVVSQAIISYLLTINITVLHNNFIIFALLALLLLLALSSILYIKSNDIMYAKKYRFMSSFYIILFYLILIIGLLIN